MAVNEKSRLGGKSPLWLGFNTVWLHFVTAPTFVCLGCRLWVRFPLGSRISPCFNPLIWLEGRLDGSLCVWLICALWWTGVLSRLDSHQFRHWGRFQHLVTLIRNQWRQKTIPEHFHPFFLTFNTGHKVLTYCLPALCVTSSLSSPILSGFEGFWLSVVRVPNDRVRWPNSHAPRGSKCLLLQFQFFHIWLEKGGLNYRVQWHNRQESSLHLWVWVWQRIDVICWSQLWEQAQQQPFKDTAFSSEKAVPCFKSELPFRLFQISWNKLQCTQEPQRDAQLSLYFSKILISNPKRCLRACPGSTCVLNHQPASESLWNQEIRRLWHSECQLVAWQHLAKESAAWCNEIIAELEEFKSAGW